MPIQDNKQPILNYLPSRDVKNLQASGLIKIYGSTGNKGLWCISADLRAFFHEQGLFQYPCLQPGLDGCLVEQVSGNSDGVVIAHGQLAVPEIHELGWDSSLHPPTQIQELIPGQEVCYTDQLVLDSGPKMVWWTPPSFLADELKIVRAVVDETSLPAGYVHRFVVQRPGEYNANPDKAIVFYLGSTEKRLTQYIHTLPIQLKTGEAHRFRVVPVHRSHLVGGNTILSWKSLNYRAAGYRVTLDKAITGNKWSTEGVVHTPQYWEFMKNKFRLDLSTIQRQWKSPDANLVQLWQDLPWWVVRRLVWSAGQNRLEEGLNGELFGKLHGFIGESNETKIAKTLEGVQTST